MAPKDKSATPSRSTPAPSGVPGAVYEDGSATSTVLGKDSPPWTPRKVKAEVRLARAAAAANGHSRETVEKHEARLDSLSTLADKLNSRTGLLEGKTDQLETGLAEQGTRHDPRIEQQDRCLRAHAQQLDVQHVALANQLAHKQLEKLATKEDLQQLIQQQQSSKRARSATASPPSSEAEEEEAPAEKEPPSYAELQAELQALKANQASTSKGNSDKAKFKGKKAKTESKAGHGRGRAPEGSAEEARRRAEYHHRRMAAEADALLAERK